MALNINRAIPARPPVTHMHKAPAGAAPTGPLCGQTAIGGGPARTPHTYDPARVTCARCLAAMERVSRETHAAGDPDFTDLTPAQQQLLTLQGWRPGCGRKQPRPQSVAKLLQRGLVLEGSVRVMGAEIATYAVPLAVHVAWCRHSAAAEAACAR